MHLKVSAGKYFNLKPKQDVQFWKLMANKSYAFNHENAYKGCDPLSIMICVLLNRGEVVSANF